MSSIKWFLGERYFFLKLPKFEKNQDFHWSFYFYWIWRELRTFGYGDRLLVPSGQSIRTQTLYTGFSAIRLVLDIDTFFIYRYFSIPGFDNKFRYWYFSIPDHDTRFKESILFNTMFWYQSQVSIPKHRYLIAIL